MPFRFTPHAIDDLFEIWDYIARDNVDAADRVESAIYEACALIANAPLRGQIREDLTPLPLRFWTLPRFPNYTIVYDPAMVPVQIIRILPGRRDVKRILKDL